MLTVLVKCTGRNWRQWLEDSRHHVELRYQMTDHYFLGSIFIFSLPTKKKLFGF